MTSLNAALDKANAQSSELRTKFDEASSEIQTLKGNLDQANAARDELQTELNQAEPQGQPPPVVSAPLESGQ